MDRFDNLYNRLTELSSETRTIKFQTIFGKKTIVAKSLDATDDEDTCFMLQKTMYDNYLLLDWLSKCKNTSGTSNIRLVIKSAWDVGYHHIMLTDISEITKEFPDRSDKITFDLLCLNILTTGRTWYEKMGFTNDVMNKNRDEIMRWIRTPISDFLVERMQPKRQAIKEALSNFNRLNGILEEDETFLIKDIFQMVKDQIKDSADNDFEKFVVYNKLATMVCEELLSSLHIGGMGFFILSNPLLSEKAHGSKKRKNTKKKSNHRKSKKTKTKTKTKY